MLGFQKNLRACASTTLLSCLAQQCTAAGIDRAPRSWNALRPCPVWTEIGQPACERPTPERLVALYPAFAGLLAERIACLLRPEAIMHSAGRYPGLC